MYLKEVLTFIAKIFGVYFIEAVRGENYASGRKTNTFGRYVSFNYFRHEKSNVLPFQYTICQQKQLKIYNFVSSLLLT